MYIEVMFYFISRIRRSVDIRFSLKGRDLAADHHGSYFGDLLLQVFYDSGNE